ncbi:MAG: translocation/assembly module TamB domain-containing protein, partial [Chitinophagaceae bacterium]
MSRDLRSRIQIDHVQIGFFNRMNLEGVLVEDQKKDTLLYAGTLQVRITDWFFLKPKAELKYIGLEDAIIKFNRTDSVWNYQFLSDYFASSEQKKDAGIEFDLKKVVMYNVDFEQKDEWAGSHLYANVASLDMDANEITVTGKTININNLYLENPYFHQYAFKGRKPQTTVTNTTVDDAGSLQWNPDNWRFLVKNISIKNGRYRNDNGSLEQALTYFDAAHLDFSNINANINNLNFLQDTLRAGVNLSTNERSGLAVQKLQTNLNFHPQMMEFNDLYLKTNRSELGDYFAMNFNDIGDLSEFISLVQMDVHFKNTSVHTDDIAFFAPDVRNWNRLFSINGSVRGSVDALNGEDIAVRIGSNTSVIGDFSLIGLPNTDQLFINVQADELRTNYADAVTFIPEIRNITNPNLRKLGAIRFNGTFTGFARDFVTYGTLQTALGTVRTDLNMKLPARGEPMYSGTISTKDFRLGQFINNQELGVVAFDGKVKGSSFVWNKLDLNIDGNVQKLQYNDYIYQNITAKGRLSNRTFDGNFVIKDPNADLHLDGYISFRGTEPVFVLDADIANANLKVLQLVEEDIAFKGKFNLNFTGTGLANFLGTARVSDATILHEGRRLSFDSLYVASDFANGSRSFTAISNEFDVRINGQFDLESLPDAFSLFLSRYYPSYIKPSTRNLPNQNFTFNITTGNVEDYVKLIDRRMSGFNNSQLSGSLNVAANSLQLDADIPLFAYQQFEFTDVVLKGEGDFERLMLTGKVSNAVLSDSMYFPTTAFTIEAQNDISDVTITTEGNRTVNNAELSAQIRTFSNGASIHFNSSSFVLNGKTWNIEEGGELDFRTNTDVLGRLVLNEGNQEIIISTQPSGIGNWNDLHITIANLNLGDVTPLILKNPRLE